LVEAGKLRQDLFYRIAVFRIDVPPLRERLDDLPLLVAALLKRAADRQGRATPRLSPELLASLYGYAWPGNVRELDNLLGTMMALEPGELLTSAALPVDYRQLAGAAKPLQVAGADGDDAAPRSLSARLQQFERHLIVDALRRNGGRVQDSARELGIDERSLRRKLARLGIRRDALPVDS
jgi:DNA-binding NtrC family response regulator